MAPCEIDLNNGVKQANALEEPSALGFFEIIVPKGGLEPDLIEDSLPPQPIAHEQRDLFYSEVRWFRAVVRHMVEAGFER